MALKATLLLEDGTLFEGYGLGVGKIAIGECCFNTSMTGYQEIHSDPSYYGQLLIHSCSHIGNYGIHREESESFSPKVSGIIIHSLSLSASRGQSISSLHDYFCQHKLLGMYGVDVRRLIRHIVHYGTLNGILSTQEGISKSSLRSQLKEASGKEGVCWADAVSTKQAYDFGSRKGRYKIAVIDYGIKRTILRCMASRHLHGRVFPARVDSETLFSYGADGYFLSNGPGDPASMDDFLGIIREIWDKKKPLFGICLGHQLLARSVGVKTFKLKHGHRGSNHSVWDIGRKKGVITSQNHGFSVDKASLLSHKALRLTHIHVHDDTVAGMEAISAPVFSVQFHPEASCGPHDTRYLFDYFVSLIEKWQK